MADLSNDAPLRILGESYTQRFILDTSGAQTVYKGEPMVIDASVDTVNARAQDSGTALADADVFLGIAAEGKSVASGASEAAPGAEIEVYVEPTIVGFKSAVFTDADLGKTVYMSDTATLSAANGTYAQIGKLNKVQDGYAFVALQSPTVLNVP